MVALVGLAQTDPVTFSKMVEEVKKAKSETTGDKPTNSQEANEKETTENKESTQEKKAESKEKNETAESAKEEKEDEVKNKDQAEKTEEAGATVDYLKFKFWNSGLKVLDSLSVILEDLNQNNGLESRRFINTFLEELTKAKHAQKESQKEHFKYKQTKEGKGKPEKASDDESESLSEKEKEEDGSESEAEEQPKGKGKWNQRDDRFPKRNDRFSGDNEGKPFRNNRDRPGKFGNEGRGGDRFNKRNDRFDGNRRGKFDDNERPEGNRRGQSWGNDRNDRRPPWKNRGDGEGENTFRNKRNFDTRDPRPRRFDNDDEGFKGGNRKRFDRS